MKYLKIFGTSLLILIIVFSLYIFAGYFNIYLGKIPVLKTYIVLSGSMEPEIPTGSIVFVKKETQYRAGDIISFSPNGIRKQVVTHRIVSEETAEDSMVFTTQGDANNAPDSGKVSSEYIHGKVVFTVPYAGYAGNFVKNPQGFILLVIVPATIIVYEELKSVQREIAKFIRKRKETTSEDVFAEEKGIPKAAILIPVFGSCFILAALTGSYFLDAEKIGNNLFSAAASFVSQSVSSFSTESLEPDPTSTPAPTVTEDRVVIERENDVSESAQIASPSAEPAE